MTLSDLREQVQANVTDRPVILVGADLDRFSQHIHELRSLGAERVMVISGGAGAGPVPDLTGYEVEFVNIRQRVGESHAEHEWQRIFSKPPLQLLRAMNAFDPNNEAVVIPWRFRTSTHLGVRPVYGPRLAEAVQLEDKTRIGALLGDLGIPEPPGACSVPPAEANLRAAMAMVDRGHGTVWSGDAARATNSGAKFVRRVRNAADAKSAQRFFAKHCEQVRVAPFLEGVACGMHAFVTRDGTAVFRPVELLILRPQRGATFVDSGFSTTFDPAAQDTLQYQDYVRRIGDEMHRRFGYEGAISVDAILTEQGWVVHDINPRQGGGLVYLQHALPDLPMHLLHHVAAAGDLHGLNVSEFEEMVRTAADQTRMVAAAYAVARGPLAPRDFPIEVGDGRIVDVQYRPRLSGGGRVELRAAAVPGERIAPVVAAAASIANVRLGLGGPLHAPADVRSPAISLSIQEAGFGLGLERSYVEDVGVAR